MLSQNERWILYYDQVLVAHPDDAPFIPMDKILPKLYDRYDSGECVKLINNNTAAIRVNDMQFDYGNKVAILLIQYADKTISDPVFGNLDTGELRVEPKLEGEGVAVSAHVVVSLESNSGKPGVYLTLIEDVPGIGRTKLVPFFTSEFRKASDFTFRNSDGAMKKCRPVVEMDGYAAQSLKDGLERGFLSGIEFVKYNNASSEFDEPEYTQVESFSAKVALRKKVNGDEAISLLNRLKNVARKLDFSEMRVRYKRSEGIQKTVPMSTAREDAGDVLFSKYEVLKVSNPLPQCSATIREDVSGKMIRMLVDERDS